MLSYLFFILVSLTLSHAITPLVIKIAREFEVIDNPGIRRFHKKATPRWGGIAFFVGILPTLFYIIFSGESTDRSFLMYFIGATILVALGSMDDLRNLGWKTKLLGMIVASSIIIFGSDTVIRQLGTYDHFGKLELGVFSIPFTCFSIVGVTNAINLIDGLNGLAGGTSLLAFIFMGLAAAIKGNQQLALFCFAFAGSLMGFLRYNFPKAKIFMGDSGSLFLGFSAAVVSIRLTQDSLNAIEPTFPVLVLLVPIFDTLRVMSLRVLNLKNPFKADKTHLHHLIVRRQVSSSRAVVLLWGLTVCFGAFALFLINSTAISHMIVGLLFSLFLSFFADALARRRRKISD